MQINLLQVTDYLKIKTVNSCTNKLTKIKLIFQICLPLQYFWQIYSLIKIVSIKSLDLLVSLLRIKTSIQ